MLDSSVFDTPDEAPGLTEYVKLCADFGRTRSIDPSQLIEELEKLRIAWPDAIACAPIITEPDHLFHIDRNEDGNPISTVILDKQAWINLLAMEAMDGEDKENGTG